jgi:hypothetical protein
MGQVEAKQWDGSVRDFLVIKKWLNELPLLVINRLVPSSVPMQPELVLETEEGNKHARQGNWIVYENGKFLLFTSETFNRVYVKPKVVS